MRPLHHDLHARRAARARRSKRRAVRAWASWGVVALALLAGAREARAQDDDAPKPPAPASPIICAPSPSRAVSCDITIQRAFSAKVRGRLRNGLRNTLLYRIYIRRAETHEPVALTALRHVVVFELWDEVFFVSQEGGARAQFEGDAEAALVERLSKMTGLRASEALPPGRYYADLIVEINPMSDKDEAELRSWIARSRGGHRTFAGGDRSFFGTFVSLFTNIRPGPAEYAFRYQTSPFSVPAP